MDEQVHENIILGAGPAGLQLAELFAQRGEPYLLIERASHAGSFFSAYPRHRKLLSINKRYTGYDDLPSRLRYDWNSLICDDEALQVPQRCGDYFPDADVLVEYLDDFARERKLAVRYDSEVTSIRREPSGYCLVLACGETLRCTRLFVASGLSREAFPNIEGIELCDTYGSMSIDPADYLDQRVMIAGKGNSAFETANHLVETTRKLWVCGKSTVRLAWASHYVGDVRAVNNDFLDTYQLKAQNNILDGELVSIRKEQGELVASVYFESRRRAIDFPCDRVLLCTGFRFDDSIFDESCKPALCCGDKVPEMTSSWESTTSPDMFFLGVLMQARDYRRTMSAFIHGFRHNLVALDQMLECRAGRPWRKRRHLDDLDALTSQTIARLSTSPELLLQPGFIADVIGIDDDGGFEYLEAVPVDYAHDVIAARFRRMLLITLEYKLHDGFMDPFAMPRGLGVEEDFYLHPVVRVHERGEVAARGYLPDDLDNDWRNDPSHRDVIGRFLGHHVAQ
jgi:thioredoxin reductase